LISCNDLLSLELYPGTGQGFYAVNDTIVLE